MMARRVVAGTVANNVRWMAALESACTPQGGTVNLLYVEKTLLQNYEKTLEEYYKRSNRPNELKTGFYR